MVSAGLVPGGAGAMERQLQGPEGTWEEHNLDSFGVFCCIMIATSPPPPPPPPSRFAFMFRRKLTVSPPPLPVLLKTDRYAHIHTHALPTLSQISLYHSLPPLQRSMPIIQYICIKVYPPKHPSQHICTLYRPTQTYMCTRRQT